MVGARWALLAVVAMIAVGAIGCGGGKKKPGGTNIAVVTPGVRDDSDWSVQLAAGAKAAAKAAHVRAQVVEGKTEATSKAVFTKLARTAQLVVAGSAADAATAAKVASATQVPALVVDSAKEARAGLVGDVDVEFAEAAYAAGIVADRAAFTRHLGIVMCDDGVMPMTDRFPIAAAYVAGARSVDPKAKASFVISGADAASAKEATLGLVKQGAQMIMDLCNLGAAGVVQGVEQAVKNPKTGETQVVSLFGDKSAVNKENVLLASLDVQPAVALKLALHDIRAGSFGKHPYRLGLANRGVVLTGTGRTPGEAVEDAMKDSAKPHQLPTAKDEVTLEAVIGK